MNDMGPVNRVLLTVLVSVENIYITLSARHNIAKLGSILLIIGDRETFLKRYV